MKKLSIFMLIAVLTIFISACSESSQNKEKTTSQAKDVSLTLDKSDYTMMNWKVDNSHTEHVVGKITADNSPVEGVKVQIADKRIMETNEKGEFYFSVNRNILQDLSIHVVNTDGAVLKGKSVDNQTKKEILKLEKRAVVHYPIVVDKVEANEKDNTLVNVHLHAVVPNGEEYPNFTPDKYKVGGTVKDADGNPVKGAVINLRRDGVEGFSMSEPSDENGEFAMYYLPEDDENHYFYVHYNEINYTLPPYKVYQFPEDISVNIDVTLPREGTIIDDKPPTLVTTVAPGALYKGTLIGVNVKEDYTINIPNRKGEFVLTLSKKAWEKKPTFFETNYKKFLEKGKNAGDLIDSSFIPKPKGNEPINIKATEK